MSDKLRKYVLANKEALEVYPFDVDSGWKQLSGELQSSASGKDHVMLWRSIAASLLLLLSVSIGIIINQNMRQSSYPMELVEAQYFYQHQIDGMMSQVSTLADYQFVVQDLSKLDEAFEELKADLKEDVHNEEVVTAMIDNYRLKLSLLEHVLKELDKQEDEEVSNI
ncbi:MAG: hypothetical protein ACI8QD_001684 [Cyclobacteriaceae bacterium]|jgi:hypothetical protein